MKLITFTHDGTTRIGHLDNDTVVDFSVTAPELPREMIAFLQAGDSALVAAAKSLTDKFGRIPLMDVVLRAPISRPSKILSVGLNYTEHAEECDVKMSDYPVVFNKQTSAVNDPYGEVYRPPESEQLDYEGELGIVIGKQCRRVPKEKAESVIAGYTVINDLTLRDVQLRVSQWGLGKSWDTHCPFGPAIVTRDEISDPHNLDLKVFVNGEVRQDLNTSDLYFDCFTIVEFLSTICTLYPGDVITTGTGAGVALYMEPQQWLKAGDTVDVEISEIGRISNKVIEEPSDTVLY